MMNKQKLIFVVDDDPLITKLVVKFPTKTGLTKTKLLLLFSV